MVAAGPTWTSFDRYDRYSALAAAVGGLDPAPGSVVDVGDASGYLRAFLPEVQSVCVDPTCSSEPIPGSVRVVGDGTRLPFADGSADVVVSCDALEHVPAPARSTFLDELGRVARRAVVVAAPFDTAGVAGAEDMVARWFHMSSGEQQPQLVEHAQHGLPVLSATVDHLEREGWSVQTHGNGSLLDWLGMMLVRQGMEATAGLAPLSGGLDRLYNETFTGRATVGPFYRHLVVATADGTKATLNRPEPSYDDSAVAGAVAQLGHLTTQLQQEMLMAAVVGVPGIVAEQVGEEAARLTTAVTAEIQRLADRVEAIEGRVGGFQQQLEAARAEIVEGQRSLSVALRRRIGSLLRRGS